MPRIGLVGDVTLWAKDGGDPFAKIAPMLEGHDLLLANLETTLTAEDVAPVGRKHVHLRTAPERAAYLAEHGFAAVALAHNHILDYGTAGFDSTLAALREHGIRWCGVGRTREEAKSPCELEVGGERVALFAAYSHGRWQSREGPCVAHLDVERLTDAIEHARRSFTCVIVSLHWGIEHVPWPSPEQIATARRLVDAGASIVWGHHPHMLQPIEVRGSGVIAYSLGNFNFWHSDVDNSESTRRGALLSVELAKDQNPRYAIVETRINDVYAPEPRPGEASTIPSMPHEAATPEQAWQSWHEAIAPVYLRNNWRSVWQGVRRYGLAGWVDLARWLGQPLTRRCIWTQVRRKLRRSSQSHNQHAE